MRAASGFCRRSRCRGGARPIPAASPTHQTSSGGPRPSCTASADHRRCRRRRSPAALQAPAPPAPRRPPRHHRHGRPRQLHQRAYATRGGGGARTQAHQSEQRNLAALCGAVVCGVGHAAHRPPHDSASGPQRCVLMWAFASRGANGAASCCCACRKGLGPTVCRPAGCWARAATPGSICMQALAR